MATAEAETSRDERIPMGEAVYDGFISYSHAADGLLAPRLQSGVQRFAKPWWKRRALRIFRDESSLSANPHLWSSITRALDQSRWFILLLSPDAAQSDWVNQEIDYWLEHKDPNRIIPVLSDGTFTWEDGNVGGDAVPPALLGTFTDEPRWVDLRFARSEEQLDLKNPGFSAAVADIASAIRGVPKDELESEEVRQHRRTVRTAWGAAVALLALALLASTAAVYAVAQGAEADRQANAAKSQALAATAIAERDSDPQLALLLTLAAAQLVDDPAGLTTALQESIGADRITRIVPNPWDFGLGSLSPDGTRIAAAESAGQGVTMIEAATGETLWETELTDDESVGVFWNSGLYFSIDGSTLLVLLSPGQTAVTPPPFTPVSAAAGLYTLEVESGRILDFLPLACVQRVTPPGGHFLRPGEMLAAEMLIEAEGGCHRNPNDLVSVGVLDPTDGSFTAVTSYAYGHLFAKGVPTISADASLLASGIDREAPTSVFDVGTGERVFSHESAGFLSNASSISTISRDGSMVLVGTEPLYLHDVASGDRLQTYQTNPSRAWFSEDESIVFATNIAGFVSAFDAATGAPLLELLGHGNAPRDVSFSRDANVLLTDSFDDPLRLWDGTTGPRGTYANIPNPVGSSADGANSIGGGLLLSHTFDETGSLDPRYAVVDLATGMVVLEGMALASVISPDGSFIVETPVTTIDRTLETGEHAILQIDGVRVIDVPSGEIITILDDCRWYVTASQPITVDPSCEDPLLALLLAISADGSVAAAGGLGNSVAAWDLSSGDRLVYRFASGQPGVTEMNWVVPIAVSADGRYLAGEFFLPAAFDAESVDRIDDVDQIEVIDLTTGQTVGSTLVGAETWALVFAPDGTRLYTVDLFTDVFAFSVPSLDHVATGHRGQGGESTDLAISPDGSLLASSSIDTFVRLWDPLDLSIAGEIEVPGATAGVSTVDFIDDTWLVVTGPRTDILVHAVDPAELIRAAVQAVDRGFTPIECESFEIDPCPTSVEEARLLYGS